MTYSFMLAKEYSENMKLPKELQGETPPLGWYLSEKYDGYRGRYIHKDKQFLSRAQKPFNAPDWFKSAMIHNHDLDGELWVGRDNFQDMGVVRKKDPIPEEWLNIKYVVYDLPEYKGDFKKRIEVLKKLVRLNTFRWEALRESFPEPFNKVPCPLIMADQIVIKDMKQFKSLYEKIIADGGEGVMIKHPDSIYEDKRSNYLLKYKPNFDAEAVIIDYKEGKGKYAGLLGGFVCKQLINLDTFHSIDDDENHEFSISGMDDEIRNNYKITHPIGTIISYEHSGKTESGKPRFGRYIRIREDIVIKDMPIVAENSVIKRENIIYIFGKLSSYEKSMGEKFKANSYGKAISSLKMVQDDSELTEEKLIKMNGIGKSLLTKIMDIVNTGTCPMYEKVKDYKDPKEIFEEIHAIGPKAAKDLVYKGFKSVQDLRDCPNLDEILNNKQKLGLKFYEDILAKIPRKEITEHEKLLKKILKKVDSSAELTIAGSYRRGKDKSGDIDILLKSKDKKTYKKFIDELTKENYLYPEHLALGPKKFNGLGRIKENLPYRRIDIMYTKPEEYPFAILYFTGSMEFNAKMRGLTLEKGLSMNEYSLKDNKTKKVVDHKFIKETDIFDYLGMDYVEPTSR
jgi:DNA ligase-1